SAGLPAMSCPLDVVRYNGTGIRRKKSPRSCMCSYSISDFEREICTPSPWTVALSPSTTQVPGPGSVSVTTIGHTDPYNSEATRAPMARIESGSLSTIAAGPTPLLSNSASTDELELEPLPWGIKSTLPATFSPCWGGAEIGRAH